MPTFHAMGTDVTVLVPEVTIAEEAERTAAVAAHFAEAEQRFSRFRADSELSRLNAAQGPVGVSPELFAMLQRCQAYNRWTEGVFDPGVGAALLSLGYDRSFAPGALDGSGPLPPPTCQGSSVAEVMLDERALSVHRPPGLMLDLGGIVKGATVDAAMRLLPPNAAIDAGGDASLRGPGPDGDGWTVDIEDPHDRDKVCCSFVAHDLAVATSGANRRQWRLGDETVHHLIDPQTLRPARSDLVQVTAIARSVLHAEVIAKSVYLLGETRGRRWLESLDDVGAWWIDTRGRVATAGAWASVFAQGAPG